MPLNDKEQRILEEIERQFHQEDPKLATIVSEAGFDRLSRRWRRLAISGFVLGLIVMLSFFTLHTFVALAGFNVMVISAGWLAMSLRHLQGKELIAKGRTAWLDRAGQRRRRGR